MNTKIKIVVTTFLLLLVQPIFANGKNSIYITKISDGDTVKAKIDKNEFSIRLIGIDCFETSKIHRAYKQAYFNKLSIEEVIKKWKFFKRIS